MHCLIAIALTVALPLDGARAQSAQRVARIGWVGGGSPGPDAERRRAELEQAFRDLGYGERRPFVIVDRYARGDVARLPELVADLVRDKVDVIVTAGEPAALAAKKATTGVPIVATEFAFDPEKGGLIASLAKPGGNVTGVASLGDALWEKRLSLLKELSPGVARIAVLWNPANPGNDGCIEGIRTAAQALGWQAKGFETRDDKALQRAFDDIGRERVDAVVACWDAVTLQNAQAIGDFVVKRRLPSVMPLREFTEGGALLSSGVNLAAHRRRAAYYVDRILKGAAPATLPMERTAQFELVVNTRTAAAIGVTLPGALMVLADEDVSQTVARR
jgi:putative ABC transport system substrate-binding protein